MSTITNLNKTTPEELRILLEAVQVKIKKKANDRYELYCPNCTKPEAYIYFKGGTRTIKCNRENNCDFKEDLWQCISNKQGIDPNNNSEMLRYINQTLGHEFKELKYEQNGNRNERKTFISKAPELDKKPPVKTIEELEQEAKDTAKKQKFFKACHQIFIDTLNNQDDPQVAFSLKYLREVRGYNDEQIKLFKLGFFPDKNNLVSLLQEKYSYSSLETEELLEKYFNGILKNHNYHKLEEDGKGRITFTWYNSTGGIAGFSMRKPTTDSTIKAKYLDNNGLDKSNHLFNLSNLAEENSKNIVIVEGLLDALSGTYFALQEEETKNYHFVATGGSQITDNQIACLKSKGYSKVILLPDKDKAGNKGFENSSIKLTEQDITPYIASIPDDYEVKDIDELIRKYQDSIDFNLMRILENAKPANNTIISENVIMNENMNIEEREEYEKRKTQLQQELKNKFPLDQHSLKRLVDSDEKHELHGKIKSKLAEKTVPREIIQDIKRYNNLLAVNYEEDEPYSMAQALGDLSREVDGLKTGFTELDKYVVIQPATLTFMAGRPSHGKTTVMLNMLRNMITANPDEAFLFYSYEERHIDIWLKIILAHTAKKDTEIEGIKNDNIGSSYFAKAKDHLKNYALAIKKKENGEMISIATHIGKAYQEVELWITEGRLQIMTDKPNVESLTGAIIERVKKVENKEKDENGRMIVKGKKVAAIFIDYVQKLDSEEKVSNRQQELHKVCKDLLNTSRDGRVNAAIILGAQANREVQSLETFQLENMREAGDIEQDANLVIGVWDEEAGERVRMQEFLSEIKMKLRRIDIGLSNSSKLQEEKEKLEKAEKNINERMQSKAGARKELTLKILKNRNGQNNQDCIVASIPERFHIKNIDQNLHKI